MVVDCGVFIDQFQLFNIYMCDFIMGKIISMYFIGWKLGFKIGMYYFCIQVVVQFIQFIVDQEVFLVQDSVVVKILFGFKKCVFFGSYMLFFSVVFWFMVFVKDIFGGFSNGVFIIFFFIKIFIVGEVKLCFLVLLVKFFLFKVDVLEGDSFKVFFIELVEKFKEEFFDVLVVEVKKEVEDNDDESKECEVDIYFEVVFVCKLNFFCYF